MQLLNNRLNSNFMAPYNRSLLKLLVVFLALSFFSCDRDASNAYFRDADFNADWQFHMGDINDPSIVGEDESEWIPVHRPGGFDRSYRLYIQFISGSGHGNYSFYR